jgi:hypothetical protein
MNSRHSWIAKSANEHGKKPFAVSDRIRFGRNDARR